MKAFILTIVDDADFQRLKHKSAWASRARAQEKATAVVAELMAKEPEWGDTFDVRIEEFEVQQ